MRTKMIGICLIMGLLSCKKEAIDQQAQQGNDDTKVLALQTAATEYPAYTVRTIAGIFEPSSSDPHLVNGAGPVAKFWKPHGLTVTGDGNIYIADFFNNAIRKLSTQNKVSTVPLSINTQTGGGLLPEAVGVANDGTYYIVSTGYGIRIYNKDKGIDIYSRIGNSDSNLDIEKDSKGVMWFVNDNSLGKITKTTIQRNVVNFSSYLAPNETLRGIGVGPNGVKYISTATQLFKVSAEGLITKLLPNQKFVFISGIAVSASGDTLYIADGNAIKMIYQNKVTTIAKPTSGDGRDGVGLAADVVAANLALSNGGKSLFVSDTRNTIRKITLP